MAPTRDIVIIGAGHNGLVTAFYLAKAGFKPLVLDARGVAGGAAVTEAFHPGFRGPTLAHSLGPLRPDIARDMQLEKHGLKILHPAVRLFAPSPDGHALFLFDDISRTVEHLRNNFSAHDADGYAEFQRTLERIAASLRSLMSQTPPSIDSPSGGDLLQLLKTGKAVRGLGKKDMFRLLRWGPMAVADLVAEWFQDELVRATLAALGIFGTFYGPWSAGSCMVLLLRALADSHLAGPSSTCVGGIGA